MATELRRRRGLESKAERRAWVGGVEVVENFAEGGEGDVGAWVGHAVEAHEE